MQRPAGDQSPFRRWPDPRLAEQPGPAPGFPPAVPHLEPRALREALGNGLSDDGRRTAMAHFAARCPVCRDHLRQVARGIDSDFRCDLPFDPVLAALQRWVDMLRHRRVRDCLRPTHRRTLELLGERDLSFCRLVIEEARQAVLEGRHPAPDVARAGLEAIRSDMIPGDRAHLIDLRGLAWIYCADAFRRAGDHHESTLCLERADGELRRGRGDPEIRATYFEMHADLARVQGAPFLAFGLIDMAEELLRHLPLAGRLAETLMRKGFVLMRLGRDDLAAEHFRRALDSVPAGTDARLRLDALHHLAVVKVQGGDFDAGQDYLREAEPLCDECRSPLIAAQRRWLLGLMAFRTGELEDAERDFLRSLDGLLGLGRVIDALMVVVNLGQLYRLSDRRPELEEANLRLRELLKTPEARLLSADELQRILKIAGDSGFDVELIDPSSGRPPDQDWVH